MKLIFLLSESKMSSMSSETQVMNILEKYFKTKGFISHQISSYNHMIQHSLQGIVGEESVIDVEVKPNVKYRVEFGQVHIGKPQVIEEDRTVRNLYPAESRLRNDTYNAAIALDIVTFLTIDGVMKETKKIDKYIIGHIPVMVNSSKCNLYGLSKHEKIAAGECPEDEGGYFIIGGKERVLITQERAAYNMIGVHKQKAQSKHSYVSEVRSMSDTTGHSVLVQAKIAKNNRGICFSLPYINYEIPVGVVFKALGFEVRDFPYLLGVSLHTRKFFKVIYEEMGTTTQEEALEFIGKHAMHVIQQDKRSAYASQILENEIFPHMGVITHSLERAMFLGTLVKKLLETASESGIRPCDDRDNIANKRFEVAGVLVSSLFRSLFKRLVRSVTPLVQKRPDIAIALSRFNTVTTGFRSCFATGKWGVQKNSYVRQGVSQVLSRLTLGAFRSHLRRIVIPIGKEGKNTQIRQLHGSQIFFICLFETPEGHASGIVKNFSMTCEVTNGINGSLAREVIEQVDGIIAVVDIGDDISILADAVRIYLNGNIIGITEDPSLICTTLRDLRDKRHIPREASIAYDDIDQEIHIATDSGRLIRPLFSLDSGNKLNVINPDTTWYEMVDDGIVKYRDAAELENMVIAMEPENLATNTEYDLLEIHPSMMMGVCASIIPFPDHSQSPRNCYQSAMGKQALGIYALSNAVRADTIVHLLNSPQAPLTTTKIASFMGFDKLPSGQNIMVAIATYTGFNQEDSIIMNKGAIDRGIFRVTTFKTVSHVEKKKGTAYNESIQFPPADIRKRFYKYDKLGDDGIAKVGQKVEKNDVLIGRVLRYTNKQGVTEYKDCSTVAKMNEAGIIDKVIIGTTPEGFKFVKVKIRSTCIPEVGDKLASKSAQKGTIGAIYASHDMPFTEDGLIPDIIINPHCLSGDSVIRLSTGEVKYIKDIYDKDFNITTVNPETLEISNTKYNQGFVKDTVEMKELTTISGRKIKCTPEHKFLVVVGEEVVWKEAKDILPYSDKMLIHHSILPVAETNENELIIQAPVDTSNKYWTRLSDLGYVGVAISLEKKMILARLLGITDSDGHLRIRNKTTGSMRYKIYVGELEDIVEIQNDVKTLGFKIPIYRRSQWTFDVELEPALGFLMYQIGTCIGNKTKSLRVFPQWIKNACLSVKREFLSGYQGGDGSKVGVNWKMPQQQVRIRPIPMRTMNDEHIKSSHMGYLKEFQQVYKEFGIEATIQEYKTKSDDKTDLKLYISTTEANIEKFISTVGYRYCNHKRRESRLPIEYFKTKNNGIKFEYQKFKDCFQKGDLITTFIETNVDIPPEPVYDFTTSSENHSFIANSFVSHNCIPSRMTINQLIESLGSMLTTIDGERRDATAFTKNSTNIVDKIQEELLRAGLNPNGECRMRNGFTGDMMDAHIFMGPTYYQRLKHMVKDKMHARAHGDCQVLTRQPLEGRSRDGGLRFGEMERDASLAHGTAAFLKERLLEMSDYFEVDVCTDCRQISKAGQCMFCGKDNIVRVQLPYACKLLFHELQSMCLKIDLLTE